MTDLFRAIFDATVDAIVVVDAATHTIVEANAQALVDSGYRLDELEGSGHRMSLPVARQAVGIRPRTRRAGPRHLLQRLPVGHEDGARRSRSMHA